MFVAHQPPHPRFCQYAQTCTVRTLRTDMKSCKRNEEVAWAVGSRIPFVHPGVGFMRACELPVPKEMRRKLLCRRGPWPSIVLFLERLQSVKESGKAAKLAHTDEVP